MSKKYPVQNTVINRTQLMIELCVSSIIVLAGLSTVYYMFSTPTGEYLRGEKTLIACMGLFVVVLAFFWPIHNARRLVRSLAALCLAVGLSWVAYIVSSMPTEPFAGLLLHLASLGAGAVAVLLIVGFLIADAYKD